MLNGQCYCGSVRILVEDALSYAFFCHCSRCRRVTGSAFAAIGAVELPRVRVSQGEELVLRLGESPDGYACVCKSCCSRLFNVVRERRYAHIPLGVLTDAPSRLPDHHIFVGSKAPWHEITDNLPQYEELPG